MIDWQRVDELRDEIGVDDFREVVDLFLEEVEEVIDRLATDPNPARLEDELHLLKGSALNLGFQNFSTLCAQGEAEAAAGRPDSIDIAAIIDCFQTCKTHFLSQLSSEHAA